MSQAYRFDPYTGQPIQPSRTWLGNGYAPREPQPPVQRQEQSAQSQVICRPVASYDEAKAVPTDFSGVLTIMPDWSHGYIYVKALADDGNPVFRAYRYEPPAPEPAPAAEYAPLAAVELLGKEIEALRGELAAIKAHKETTKEAAEKPAGKGTKAQ